MPAVVKLSRGARVQTERADEMRGFRISGFNSEEIEHIQRNTEYLRLAVPAVLDALYDHLLSLPEKREFFETQDIQHRKQSLVSWITRTIEEPHDEQYWGYLTRVGKCTEITAFWRTRSCTSSGGYRGR